MIGHKILLLIIGCTLLTACKTSKNHYDPPPVTQQPVTLTEFAVVDSYGVDSGVYPADPLTLDPYAYDGLFEVYWDVSPNRDYSYYLSVGPTPNVADSVTFYDAACGPGLFCDRTGYEVCSYSLNYDISCANQAPVNVSSWIYEVPQTLYLFSEVCGPRGCDTRRLRVQAL